MEKLFKLVACMLLARSHYWNEHNEPTRASAYLSAYHLLCYAIHDREDCIAQWDFYEPASDLVFQHPYVDVWDYEEMSEDFFKKWVDDHGKMW